MISKEINLVCMSGQGAVQVLEIMAKAFYAQHRMYVGSVVFPGTRAKSCPVVSYLKVSEQPVASISANYEPSEVIVFWDGLLRIVEKGGHPVVQEAIGRLRRGVLLVNSPKPPQEIHIPFTFEGTIAAVDATGIANRLLKRNPPPVGVTLLGAYAAVTNALDIEPCLDLVRERFPGLIGERNAEAAREAYANVRIFRGAKSLHGLYIEEPAPRSPEEIPDFEPIIKDVKPGFREGSPYVWRDTIPTCDDSKCKCKEACLSELICPDNAGFIVRKGIPGALQGYRIDVDHCRGCGLCVQVCVYGALQMVSEEELLRRRPDYAGVSVEPYLKTALRRRG